MAPSTSPAPAPAPAAQETDTLMHENNKASYCLPSWLYPFKGIIFFISHPYMYPYFRASLIPCVALSTVVLFNLFLFTYLPQVAFLAIFQGWSAWLNGTILVLGEGAALVAVLYEALFADQTQVDIFDTVLLSKGHDSLVLVSRDLKPVNDNDNHNNTNNNNKNTQTNPAARLLPPHHPSTAIYAPFSIRQIAEFVFFLPLNLIPYVGVPLFLLLTGYRAGPLLHWRYFALKRFGRREREAFVRRRRWGYTWFGVSYLVLQLVPVLSIFFLLTSAAGSAAWAAHLEDVHVHVREGEGEGDEESGGGREEGEV